MSSQSATPLAGPHRPFHAYRLRALPFVLVAALTIVSTAPPAEAARSRSCAVLTTTLATASTGLLMPSETDAPFTPVCWPDGAHRALTIPRLLRLTGHPADSPVEVLGLDEFFRNVAYPQPWHDTTQAAQVPRFRRLVEVLRGRLTGVRVYRVDSVRIDVYIVGTSGCTLAGLSTVVVET